MDKAQKSLILTTTDGHFTMAEVPQLYVQIQEHRAVLERALCRQLSFEEALKSWFENIYTPIMEAIESTMRLSPAVCGLSEGEIYFRVSEIAAEDDYRDIPLAVERFVDGLGITMMDAILSMLHLRKAGRAAV